MRTVPKIFLITGLTMTIGAIVEVSPGVVALAGILCFGFLLDVLFDIYSRHREALLWFLDNVHITDKPIGKSDAPESLKKLLRKEEDKKNH